MFHKEGFNIILSAFVIVSLLIISVDYFEVKFALTIKVFLVICFLILFWGIQKASLKQELISHGINMMKGWIARIIKGQIG